MAAPDPAYPRPQLVRERWTDLCGTWQFAYDDADPASTSAGTRRAGAGFDREIVVPYPPESPGQRRSANRLPPGRLVPPHLRRRAAPTGERVLLHFGAVDYGRAVWVNGALVATPRGRPHPVLRRHHRRADEGGEQVVVVRAEDDPHDLTQPRGKQDWHERAARIWYERTTGIWQPVWLEPVPATARGELCAGPPTSTARCCASGLAVAGPVRGDLRRRRAAHPPRGGPGGRRLPGDGDVVQRDIAAGRAASTHERRSYLWAPDHPNLVDAEVALLRGDEVVDEVGATAGSAASAASGGHFLLNGRALPAADGAGAELLARVPPGRARRGRAAARGRAGQGARLQRRPDPPEGRGPAVPRTGATGSACSSGARCRARSTSAPHGAAAHQRVARGPRTRRSAPALVAWVPFNESWGVPNLEHDPAQRHAVQALYHLTRAIDPTRPVVGNDGWENVVTDILGVHDYSPAGEVLRERYGSHEAVERTLRATAPYYRPIILPGRARTGAADRHRVRRDHLRPGREDFWNGYGAVNSAEELLERYARPGRALLSSPVVAGFCYTQLTDTAQERNGLLTEDRRPKVDPGAIAAVNRQLSAAVPGQALEEVQIVHAARARRLVTDRFRVGPGVLVMLRRATRCSCSCARHGVPRRVLGRARPGTSRPASRCWRRGPRGARGDRTSLIEEAEPCTLRDAPDGGQRPAGRRARRLLLHLPHWRASRAGSRAQERRPALVAPRRAARAGRAARTGGARAVARGSGAAGTDVRLSMTDPIPGTLARTVREVWGADGDRWLAALPARARAPGRPLGAGARRAVPDDLPLGVPGAAV